MVQTTLAYICCQPFKENEKNPAQNVKVKIPDRIAREGRISIKIIKYPFNFRNVITDMDIVPTLWNGKKNVYDPGCDKEKKLYIDVILHLGMNFGDI